MNVNLSALRFRGESLILADLITLNLTTDAECSRFVRSVDADYSHHTLERKKLFLPQLVRRHLQEARQVFPNLQPRWRKAVESHTAEVFSNALGNGVRRLPIEHHTTLQSASDLFSAFLRDVHEPKTPNDISATELARSLPSNLLTVTHLK
jgi:hypothetical protein